MSQTTPRAIAFKITAIVLIAYFAFVGAAHYSDANAVHWMLFYLTSALGCLLTVLRKDSLPVLYIVIGMAVMEIAITGDGFLSSLSAGAENSESAKMSVDKSYLGLRRDFLGALISMLVSVCLVIRLRNSVRK